MNMHDSNISRRHFLRVTGAVGSLSLLGNTAWGRDENVRQGKLTFSARDEAAVPPLFRLPKDEFAYGMREVRIESKTIEIWDVNFPSPIQSPVPENNTVHTVA